MTEQTIKDKFGNIYFDTEQEVADKVQHFERETCPICGNEQVNYGSLELEGEQVYFPCYCTECGADWKEWYELTFVGVDSVVIIE